MARHRHGGAIAAICVTRDHTGAYWGSSAVVFRGVSDPIILESHAYREGLALAEDDLYIQRMMVASDCQSVMNDINQGTGGHHSAIIHEITDRRDSFTLRNFVHERRNHNFEVHNLASLLVI